jgi:hypothetical protein
MDVNDGMDLGNAGKARPVGPRPLIIAALASFQDTYPIAAQFVWVLKTGIALDAPEGQKSFLFAAPKYQTRPRVAYRFEESEENGNIRPLSARRILGGY